MSWKHCQFNARVWCAAKILLQNCLYFQLVAFPFSSHGKRYGKDGFSLSQPNPKCNMHKQVLPFPQVGVPVKAILAICKRKIFHTLVLFLNAFLYMLTLEKIYSVRRQNWIGAACDLGEKVTAELRIGSSVHLLFLL